MSQPLCFDFIPDDELLERLSTLVDRHRRCEAEVVAHIAEVDARQLYLGRACSSMFAYAVEVLHLSEHEAYLRIACARASRRFPVLLEMLADGRLHLSAIAKLTPHLTEDNSEALLGRAVHKTTRQIEELCAEVAPHPDVPSRMRKLPRVRPRRQPGDQLGTNLVPGATAEGAARSTTASPSATAGSATNAAVVTTSEPTAATHAGPETADTPAREAVPEMIAPARPVIEPIAPARYSVRFTASAELRDKLGRAKALLRHKDPDADLGEVIDEAVTLLLGKLEAKRFGKTKIPRKALANTDTSASSRHVPAAVRRVVFDRDQGRCAYVDEATGRRCSCTDPGRLEYHHLTPFALGCDHDPDRIELRCRAHNQYQAELDFGSETMARCRTGTSRAREPQPAYGPGPGAPGNRSGRASPPSSASRGRVRWSRRSASPQQARRRRSPWWNRRASPPREALRARYPVARDRSRLRNRLTRSGRSSSLFEVERTRCTTPLAYSRCSRSRRQRQRPRSPAPSRPTDPSILLLRSRRSAPARSRGSRGHPTPWEPW